MRSPAERLISAVIRTLVGRPSLACFREDRRHRRESPTHGRSYQVTRNRVQLQNRLEALLEEAYIKISSLVSDLLGASARRMLAAVADGETNHETLAALADRGLRATQEQLRDALG